ncbi:primosomal protein DnaI [Peribacillus alkalitolerans]|uniref:primosomal protein DnaI n=1 Tax=Peribacillus alkalitolerans TaxID=1550385 RepID=UPI0013D39546|nr:primosomal protein DnaI [Peribacillus alkalitolerans]
MEKITNRLSKLTNTAQFNERYETIRKEVLNDPDIAVFINKHSTSVTKEMVDKSLVKLYEFSTQSKNCEKCPSLEGCINMMEGYHPELIIQRNRIDLQYDRCPRKLAADDRKRHESFIKSLYVPKDILSASMADFNSTNITEERLFAVSEAMQFIEDLDQGRKAKGLYIHGSFGVGKSYLLGAIANELADRKIPTMIVYVPDFFREMKASIQDHSLNDKIDTIKKANILMLDDIGAETMSSWARDEVLGPILQFRMLESLPTFFTSNFDFQGLETHMTTSQRGEVEQVKAKRLMERIRTLAKPVMLKGKNLRD